MPIPERKFTPEFFDVVPPVIPVKFNKPKGRGKGGVNSILGFHGFDLFKSGDKFRCITSPNAVVKSLADGYAEIPDTKHNRELLKTLSKPMNVKATYDRGTSVDKEDPDKLWFRDNKGKAKLLTQDAIDEGEIRVVGSAHIVPPYVTPLPDVRKFDVNDKRTNDAELAQKVRPWLKAFVRVDEAVMTAPAI